MVGTRKQTAYEALMARVLWLLSRDGRREAANCFVSLMPQATRQAPVTSIIHAIGD